MAGVGVNGSVDGCDEISHLATPGADRDALAAQVCDHIGVGVIEEGGDVLQGEPEPAVDHHVLESEQVGVVVEPVARGAALAGDRQANLVVVVQASHRGVEALDHLARGQAHHPRRCRPEGPVASSCDLGHGDQCRASRDVRVKPILKVPAHVG